MNTTSRSLITLQQAILKKKVKRVFLTHGHIDHIGGILDLQLDKKCEVSASIVDAHHLSSGNSSYLDPILHSTCKPIKTSKNVKEGDNITGLSIFNCHLNAFPSEILRIKSLKRLALRRNKLNDLPRNIGFLSNLEWLDLRLNELESLPNAIGLLYKLKNLNLSSNKLTIVPDSIGDLLTLKVLNLSNNKLKSMPECIENLNCLETLNLKANYWITIPESIEKLKEQGLQIVL